MRNFFTTGVVLTHPAFDGDGVDAALLAHVFLEALLMLVPFERQDVSVAIDRHRAARGDLAQGRRFLALNDLHLGKDNEEFVVEAVFFSPAHNELCYRGRLASTPPATAGSSAAVTIAPVSRIVPVPGESVVQVYDLETGDMRGR